MCSAVIVCYVALGSGDFDGDSPNLAFQAYLMPGKPKAKKHTIAITREGSLREPETMGPFNSSYPM